MTMYQILQPQEPAIDPATGRFTRVWWRYFQTAFRATGNGQFLGTAALENIGTSGANVPLLDNNNLWNGSDNFVGGFQITSSAVEIAGPLTLLGTFPTTLNMTGPTNIVLPTSGTLLTNRLPNADLFVGSSTNIATPVAMTGDASIVSSGVLALSTTGAIASTYTLATVQIDAKGRILSATSGSGTGGTVTSISSGAGISTTPSPITSTGTVALIVPVTPVLGGTGTTTLLANAVLLGEGTTAVGFASTGVAGRVLLDQGSGVNPVFQAVSGAIALTSTGVASINASTVTNGMLATSAALSVKVNNATTSANPTDSVSGTWVPTDASGAGLTLTASNCKSVQIGPLVFVWGQITYPTTADVSSNLIGGLTVPVPNTIQLPGTFYDSGSLATAAEPVTIPNSSQFALRGVISGTRYTNVQLSGVTFSFVLAYSVT